MFIKKIQKIFFLKQNSKNQNSKIQQWNNLGCTINLFNFTVPILIFFHFHKVYHILSTFHTHFTISLTQFPCAFSQPYHPFHHVWNKKNQRQEKQSFLIQSTPPPPGLTPFNPIQFMDNVLQHCYEQISYRLWGRRWIWSISHLGIWFWSQNWFFLCGNKKGFMKFSFGRVYFGEFQVLCFFFFIWVFFMNKIRCRWVCLIFNFLG
jgi:hypothetical protein